MVAALLTGAGVLVAPAASEPELQIRSSAERFTARPESGYYVKEWTVDGQPAACEGGVASVGTSDTVGGRAKICVLSQAARPRDVRAVFGRVRDCAAENRAAGNGTVADCGACEPGFDDGGDGGVPCAGPDFHTLAAAGDAAALSELAIFRALNPAAFAAMLTVKNSAPDGDTPLQSALTAAVASDLAAKPFIPAVVDLVIESGANVSLRTGTTAAGTCNNGRWNLYDYVAMAGLLGNNSASGDFNANTVHNALRITLLAILGETGLDASRRDCAWGNATPQIRAAYWGLDNFMSVAVKARNIDLNRKSDSGTFPLFDVIEGRNAGNFPDARGLANLSILIDAGADVGNTKDGKTPLDRLIEIHEATLSANPGEPFADNAAAAKILRDAGMPCLLETHAPELVAQFCPTDLVVSVVFTDPDNGEITAASAGAVVTSGGEIAPGRTVTLTATPDTGYFVRRWTGDCADPEKGEPDSAGDGQPKTCSLFSNTGGELNAAAEFVPQTANASLVAEVKKSAPSLAEVRRILAAQDPSPDAEDDDSVPVLLIAAASLHAEVVSVLVTAGADVAQPHPTDAGAVPHMMVVNPLDGTCNNGDETRLLRDVPGSLRVLRYFHDALVAADREADYNWGRKYGEGLNHLEVEKFLPWRFHNCVGNTATDDREAYIDIAQFLRDRGRQCNTGGTHNPESRIICENHERVVDYPAPSELIGGRIVAVRVDRDGAETAIDPGGVTLDSRYSLRFTPQASVGGHLADWSGDCAATDDDARCDIPRGPDNVNVSVAFRSAAAVAGLIAEVKKPNPSLAQVRSHLRAGASPDTDDENGVPVLLVAAASLHAEVVSVLVTAGANVTQGHPTEHGAVPHMMVVFPLAHGNCDPGTPHPRSGRNLVKSARVLKHFNDALVASERESEYDWTAAYPLPGNLLSAARFLTWRYGTCLLGNGGAPAAEVEAYIDISRIILSHVGHLPLSPPHQGRCDAQSPVCIPERTVAYPADSQIIGGSLSVVRVAADETAIPVASGATIDSRFSVRVSAAPDAGLLPEWSGNCGRTLPGILRCDIPRGTNNLNISVAFAPAATVVARRAGELLTLEIAKTNPDPASVVALLDLGANPDQSYNDGSHILARAAYWQGTAEPDSLARAQIVSILVAAGANPNAALSNSRTVPILIARESGDDEQLPAWVAVLRHFIGGLGARFADDNNAPDHDWTNTGDSGNALAVLKNYCDLGNFPAPCREIAELLYERGARCGTETEHDLCARPRDSVPILVQSSQTGNLHTVTARDFGRDTFDLALPGAAALAAAAAAGWGVTLHSDRPRQIVLSRNGSASGDALFTVTATYKTSIVARETEIDARVQAPENRPVRFSQPAFGGTLKASAAGSPVSNGDALPINRRIVFSAEPAAGYRVYQWAGSCETLGRTGGHDSGADFSCEIPASASAAEVSVAVAFAKICDAPFLGFGHDDCRLHSAVPPVGTALPATENGRRAFCEAFGGTYFPDNDRCQVLHEPLDNPTHSLRACEGETQCDQYFEAWRTCGAERKSVNSGTLACQYNCPEFDWIYQISGQGHRVMGFHFHCRASANNLFDGVPLQTRVIRLAEPDGGQLSGVSDRGVTLAVGNNPVFKSSGASLTATPDADRYVSGWDNHCAGSDIGDPNNLGETKTCAISPGSGDQTAAVRFQGLQDARLTAEIAKPAPNLASVVALLNAGADPNLKVDARPLLIAAALKGQAELVSVLITAGADPSADDGGHQYSYERTLPHLLGLNLGLGEPRGLRAHDSLGGWETARDILRAFIGGLSTPGVTAIFNWNVTGRAGQDERILDNLRSRYGNGGNNNHVQSDAERMLLREMAAMIRAAGGTCATNTSSPICAP